VFRAVGFYNKNLSKAGKGLNVVTVAEQLIIYLFSIYAIIALLVSLFNPSSQLFPPKPPKIPHFFTESANNPFIINSDYFC